MVVVAVPTEDALRAEFGKWSLRDPARPAVVEDVADDEFIAFYFFFGEER
jgi:hypothetical protein